MRRLWVAVPVGILIFLAFHDLENYPTTWFDEGIHLHVPKNLVRYGVYADASSEGFRHYGPTISVGPTVMLPIAAAFQYSGVGLLQARVVMAGYLLATVAAFFGLAQQLGGTRTAWAATALLVSSQGVLLFTYGRQVLGEVPGLGFLAAGLWVWFAAWESGRWWRLAAAGVLIGLAMMTKQQYVLVAAPGLAFGWLANLVYYRTQRQRVFLVPGILAAACYAGWLACLLAVLGPEASEQNWARLRASTAGAALVFSVPLMERAVRELLSPAKTAFGWLFPALLYGAFAAVGRRRVDQQWAVVFVMVAVNLAWYVAASIAWPRYVFPGLALACLLIARLFADLTGGFQLAGAPPGRAALNWALVASLAVTVALPFAQTVRDVLSAPFNAPAAMAAYLNEHVPRDVVIETWEPEMGFLTDHTYHYPPVELLTVAVRNKWIDREAPPLAYDPFASGYPDYVLVGDFGHYVKAYANQLAARYEPVKFLARYQLHRLRK